MTNEFIKKQGKIPELAAKYPTLENLLAAEPDFFFAGWNYGMRIGGEVTPETLAPHGINTLVLSESCIHQGENKNKANMDLLYKDILQLGAIFDKTIMAEKLVQNWKDQLSVLSKQVQQQTIKTPKVFFFDSGEDKPFTAGRYAITTAIIENAGGRNIMDELETSWGTSSWEYVALQNPDFIILLADGSMNAKLPEKWLFLQSHPLMKYTNAVKNNRFLVLPYSDITPGPNNINTIQTLALSLYPALKLGYE